MKSKLVLRRLRIGAYVATVLVLLVFGLRYETRSLPTEGCSPLDGVWPGDRLVVDLWVGTPAEGDAVVFRGAADELLLGRVVPAPADVDERARRALATGDLWIEVDSERCPGTDSRTLGPVPVERVVGRIAFTVPF